MPLPTSGSISIAQIAAEMGASLPLNITSSAVRAFIGKPTGNVVIPTDFYGKSAAKGNLDVFSRENFVRNDGWDEWYQMEDSWTVSVVGTTITGNVTWTILSGGAGGNYPSGLNRVELTVYSEEYPYGGQSGPMSSVRASIPTAAGTIVVEA